MDNRLINILACPVCKGKLRFAKSKQEFICAIDRLAFRIEDDIPVMIENQARAMTQEEVKKWASE